MSLSSEYRVAVVSSDIAGGHTPKANSLIHAVMPNADASMCGRVEALDLTYVKHHLPNHRYTVTCEHCLKALKAERQRRGREGRVRARERHERELEEVRQQAAEEPAPLTDREAAYKKQRDDLLAFMQSAPVSSGVCCCGSDMEKHGMYDGHSPVDMWDYGVSQWAEEIKKFDAENPTP